MILSLWGLLISAVVNAEIVDRIVAVVNGEIITLSELDNAFDSYRKRIESSYKNPDVAKVIAEARLFMLNKLIEQSLVEQEAKRSGIVVKDDEVSDAIKEFLEKRKIKMEDLLVNLARERSSFAEYKKGVRNQIVSMKLIGRKIKAKIAVSEEEIGAYYLNHREDYEGKEAVRIQQILLPFPRNIDAATKAKLKKDMDMIHKRLKGGESFEALAVGFSRGPAAAAGGDIGFVERGMILPPVENAAFSMNKGEISDVIESSAGFHIIKVIDKRGAGLKRIESVRAEIKEKLEDEKMEKKFAEWIKELRDKSHIEIKL
jgi:parvulin-like peptidyl-prolyl isomerase